MTIRSLLLTVTFSLGFLVLSCRDQGTPGISTISLKNTEMYDYAIVGGDEEGATIVSQAKHYSVSEIRRNAQTNWVAVYTYQPESGYVGSDYVELEVRTGSDGASPPSNVKRVAFKFQMTN